MKYLDILKYCYEKNEVDFDIVGIYSSDQSTLYSYNDVKKHLDEGIVYDYDMHTELMFKDRFNLVIGCKNFKNRNLDVIGIIRPPKNCGYKTCINKRVDLYKCDTVRDLHTTIFVKLEEFRYEYETLLKSLAKDTIIKYNNLMHDLYNVIGEENFKIYQNEIKELVI